ncbi:IMPACT family member YigZ [Caprobacter fermentans]|uniref:IMPACT family member YigZ n=1 Tax=Caproicibacter fermentans TaxID=2576756 RepID=A0A6N8I5I8_9FIRM|nr:YigZ family protein [Caproicibacter fermentans]MVB13027.1 IMPACT family member YigZ [Caproicibacter fermentans]OCN02443.1 YigZ family protein [Clostridium sp. W14A]QNK41290.1 YigZ family protein [Caproicibacter fermentans]
MEEEYRTLKAAVRVEFTDRRSRFIGAAAPVADEEEAISFLRREKALYREANHHVYAYSLRKGGIARHSDDGEPQGTAGLPVLDVLLKSEITDAVVVVTRYFGGTLLGTGGLVRAYSHTAAIALEQSGVAVMKPCSVLDISCGYARYSAVAALIPQYGGVIDHTGYTDTVEIRFHMESKNLKAFSDALSDVTCGECGTELVSEKYFDLN